MQAEKLRQRLDALRFAKIPGYFPTPAELIARMIDAADDVRGQSILEASAGRGAIADPLRDAGAGPGHGAEPPAGLSAGLRLRGRSDDLMDFIVFARFKHVEIPVFNTTKEMGRGAE